jgi:hypothetical protein
MQTLYNQIEKKFLPFLENYREDITIHDKKALKNYKGKLIYGCRKTGSNLIKLDNIFFSYLLEDDKIQDIGKHIYDSYIIVIFGPLENKKFAYNDNGTIKEISEAKAKEYVRSEVQKIVFFYENERRKQEQENQLQQY